MREEDNCYFEINENSALSFLYFRESFYFLASQSYRSSGQIHVMCFVD